MNVSPKTAIEYRERLLMVMEHIQANMDGDLQLETLADIAGFSPYHFHRVFRAFMGEPVRQYIKRLRLRRAAKQLLCEEKSVTEVALDAGYETASAFNKAFKQMFGVSPTAFDGPVFVPDEFDEQRVTIDAEIRYLPVRKVLYVRRFGLVGGTFTKASQDAYRVLWTFLSKYNLWSHIVACLGITPDDFEVVPDADCRFDACMELADDADYQLEGEVQEQVIEAGRFAVFMHIGPYDTLWKSWQIIYRDWLPDSGETLRDAAPYEVYIDNPSHTPPDQLRTEIHVPLV